MRGFLVQGDSVCVLSFHHGCDDCVLSEYALCEHEHECDCVYDHDCDCHVNGCVNDHDCNTHDQMP